jgi:hypothetical protein
VWGNIRGIRVEGAVARLAVAGNLVWKCKEAGLHLQHVQACSEQLLIANNTLCESGYGLRFWEDFPGVTPRPGQGSVQNNLLFDADHADLSYILGRKEGGPTSADCRALLRNWRFAHNGRELRGTTTAFIVPPTGEDLELRAIPLVSNDPDQPGFARPASNSLLATGGSGNKYPDLPAYIGAVPPQGVESWDWDRTWRVRMKRDPEADSKTNK